MKPKENEMLKILQSLEKYELNIMEVKNEIKAKRLLQFPELMKNLQVVIEFKDCIIQAQDLLNFDFITDDD